MIVKLKSKHIFVVFQKSMTMQGKNLASKPVRFIYSWVVFFILWLAFTTTFATAEVVTGAVVSFILALISYETFTGWGFKGIKLSNLWWSVVYIINFLWLMLKANLNVARIVLTPSLPINPGIVEFETKLTNEYAKMVLANSITLTPGTFTVDIVGNRFYIHWIDVTVTDPQEVYKEIAEPFEKILLKIFN